MSDLKSFGKRLRELRKDLSLSQESMGAALKTSGSFIGMVEGGKNGLALDALFYISLTWGASIDWLITGEGFMYRKDYLSTSGFGEAERESLLKTIKDKEDHIESLKDTNSLLKEKISKLENKTKSV